ncbi:EAL domain-containing protein [Marinobacter apostichopi]|uniref:EAL domain-containing protein n=1 Tax=Marinobacter apostichopi TaxID=3035454 RepID=UPI0025726335|nr:EAL domain-containing protein [Marinobacter sp. LA51]
MANTPVSGNNRKTTLAIALTGAVLLGLWFTGALQDLGRQIEDQWFELLAEPVATDTVIVEIDSASIADVGLWPWPRELFAQALRRLDAAEVHSVMVDVDFSARSVPDQDLALEQALADVSRPVFLPAFVQRTSSMENTLMLRTPLPEFAGHVQLVSANMHPDTDGLVRRLGTGFNWQDTFYPGAWIAMTSGQHTATWIDFSISPRSFQYISFSDLLAGRVEPAQLRNKRVFIGATAIELGDTLAVPVYRALPGVVLQALGAETLNRGGLYRLNTGVEAGILVLCWLLAALIFTRLSWIKGLLGLALTLVGTPLAAVFAFQNLDLIIDIAAPTLAIALVYITVSIARLDTVTLEHLWLQITLRDHQAIHDRIIATANDCILCLTPGGRITQANPAMHALSKAPPGQLVDSQVRDWLPRIETELANLSGKPFDTILLASDNRQVPVEAIISTVDLSAEPLYTIVLRDLTDRIERERELEYQATHDLLTGLLNRPALFSRINQDLQDGETGALLSVNLDYFHEVNDTYGHQTGDHVLQTIAARIAHTVSDRHPAGWVARVGADSFAVWLQGMSYAEGGQILSDAIMEAVERVLPLSADSEVSLQVFCTIGVGDAATAAPEVPEAEESDSHTAKNLWRCAEDALRQAKSQRVAIHCYGAADRRAAGQRLKLVPAIRANIAANAFNLLYQPKIDLATMQPIGCEALLRWPHGRGPVVPVMTLIEVAENSRQIAPLTRWVVQAILAQENAWQARGLPRHMAVNISARLIQDRHFISELQGLLASSTGYFQFEFEITETALMSSRDLAIELASSLSQTGSTLAIDDFGTGYSSLAYLKDLNASILKIDKSFVTNIDDSRDNQTIVRSTIKMAHELGMQVVAEGIETAADEHFLRSLGCDFGQGYHYAKPLPVDELVQWLTKFESQAPKNLSDLQPFRR